MSYKILKGFEKVALLQFKCLDNQAMDRRHMAYHLSGNYYYKSFDCLVLCVYFINELI